MFGTVGTVTYQTIFIGLPLNMRFMAVKTGWFHTVLGSINPCYVTSHTTHFSIVLAGILLHLLAFRIVMADLTGHDLLSMAVFNLLLHTREGNIEG